MVNGARLRKAKEKTQLRVRVARRRAGAPIHGRKTATVAHMAPEITCPRPAMKSKLALNKPIPVSRRQASGTRRTSPLDRTTTHSLTIWLLEENVWRKLRPGGKLTFEPIFDRLAAGRCDDVLRKTPRRGKD
jgi:hypothetical protein